jgi:hypothetical protein
MSLESQNIFHKVIWNDFLLIFLSILLMISYDLLVFYLTC